MEIEVKHHKSIVSDQLIGLIFVQPLKTPENQIVDNWYELMADPRKKNDEPAEVKRGEIHLKLTLSPAVLDNFLFLVRQQLWSFGDFSIKDQTGNRIFQVEGSWPMNFYLQDNFGNTLINIKKRSLIAFQPSYDLYDPATGGMCMSITHEISFGASKFRVDMPNDGMVIRGNYYEQDYQFYRADGSVVCLARRDPWAWTDSYVVEISPTENIPLMLCAIIVIDHECHRHRNNGGGLTVNF